MKFRLRQSFYKIYALKYIFPLRFFSQNLRVKKKKTEPKPKQLLTIFFEGVNAFKTNPKKLWKSN